MSIKALIVEDEKPAAEHLVKLLQECDHELTVLHRTDSISQTIAWFAKHPPPDLMFLDIKMPQMTGIDFLKTLKRPPKVIITTAYSQYALDGFELDVVDYLMKPVTFERFFKSVNKYFQSGHSENVELEGGNGVNHDAFIYVKENKKVIKIYLKEIHFIEGLNEYIRIHTDNRRVVVKSSLQSIENKLPSEQFIRIHKSYIISIPGIRAFNATTIELENAKLRIGRNYKNQVFSALHYKQEI